MARSSSRSSRRTPSAAGRSSWSSASPPWTLRSARPCAVLAELDELERQAREAAAQAEEAAPGEGGAEITEIHGGPQEHDSEESWGKRPGGVLPRLAVCYVFSPTVN
ncbi:hypothetical protein M5E87_23460 [Flavonifractor plautii]|nr:hypothetical protein M5E87_23460 [Flavonifractor plautii]